MSYKLFSLLTIGTLLAIPSIAAELKVKIKPGESLSEIADKYEVSINSIIILNNIKNPNEVQAGQTIKIPSINEQKVKSNIHIVQVGDTLEFISNKYGVDQENIIRINNLRDFNYLYPGQKLTILKNNKKESSIITDAQIHIVKAGDTLSQIALNYQTSKQEIIKLNKIYESDLLYLGQKIKVPTKKNKSITKKTTKTDNQHKNKFHIIKRGDTLNEISQSYNISLNKLIKINSINNPNDLNIGDKIYLYKEIKRDKKITKNQSNSIKTSKPNKPDWRNYGPLRIDWSSWHPMGGSYIAPTINKDGKALYLAVNCLAKKINATGWDGNWKDWNSPIDQFEYNIIKDLCKFKKS